MDELWNPEPLLPRWLKIVSLILAGTAWVEFMVVPLLALYRGAPDVLLWILPVAWLLFYGAAFGIAVGMAFIARGGSWMDQQPAFIKWYFGFFCSWLCRSNPKRLLQNMADYHAIDVSCLRKLYGHSHGVFVIRQYRAGECLPALKAFIVTCAFPSPQTAPAGGSAREAGFTRSPDNMFDTIVRVIPAQHPVVTPASLMPQGQDESSRAQDKIDNNSGSWYVGSQTIGNGVDVSDTTWQIYQDHARHFDRVTMMELQE